MRGCHSIDTVIGGAQVVTQQVRAMQPLLPAFDGWSRLYFLGLREAREGRQPRCRHGDAKLADGVTGVDTQHSLASS